MSPALPGMRRVGGTGAGIGLALLAYFVLALHDGAAKWLVGSVAVWQVLFVRGAVVSLLCLAAGRRRLVADALRTRAKPALAARGLVAVAAWGCYFTAAKGLSLTELQTLYFTAPVMVVLLAGPLLGEPLSRLRLLSVGLGFCGIVAAAGPQGLRLSLAAGLALLGAGLWALGIVLTRGIARRERSLVQLLWSNLIFAAVTGTMSLLRWHAPTSAELVLLLAAGMLGGLGQFCLIESARHVAAAVTATLEYSALLWGAVLGYLIWGELPGPSLCVAAMLIVGGGVFLLIGERRPDGSSARAASATTG